MNSERIRVAILGANGRMGQILSHQFLGDPVFELVARIDARSDAGEFSVMAISDIAQAPAFDILVDFSTPSATESVYESMRGRKAAWLVATTGLSDRVREKLQSLSESQPILIAANTSLGIALMQRLARQAAAILKDWDCEIVETHHRNKVDAPSGTAKAIAEAIADARKTKERQTVFVTERAQRREVRPEAEIGISSLRGGTVAGEHRAIWLGEHEQFEIRHTAESREIFANGARKMASWLVAQKPGMYSIQQWLDAIL